LNDYEDGSYQKGYRDYLRKCAEDKTTAEISQVSCFYAGYKYAAQHAIRTLTRYIDSPHAYDQATVDILAHIRMTIRKGIL
jgi:hypothetical protein